MRRTERAAHRKQRRDGGMIPGVELAYALPPVSGLVMWAVSGEFALALGFLGAGLAAVGRLVARFYDLQLEGEQADW